MPITPLSPMQNRLLDAIEPHVIFDGWSEDAFQMAIAESGLTEADARAACPRGATDLAVAYHQRGDAAMVAQMQSADLASMRYSERVAAAIRFRLEVVDRDMVRRGMTLFSMPHLAPVGTQLVWGTADLIWETLGDTSDDINWYSKRTILSGVYASCVVYWLGDETGGEATAAFIDRRIDNVMQFEKFKSSVKKTPVLGQFATGMEKLLSGIKAPKRGAAEDLPGRWTLND